MRTIEMKWKDRTFFLSSYFLLLFFNAKSADTKEMDFRLKDQIQMDGLKFDSCQKKSIILF